MAGDIRYFFEKEQVLNRIFVLYGNTTDCYQTASHTWLSFDRMVESHLKYLGYKIVLFYRGEDVLESYDEELRENFENAFPEFSDQNSHQEKTRQTEDKPEAGKQAPEAKKPHSLLGSFLDDEDIDEPPKKAAQSSTIKKRESRISIKEELIPSLLDRVMKNNREGLKSCVVFTNCWQIFERSDDRINREIAAYMSGWYALPTVSNNIAVLLFNEPRLGSLGDFLHNRGSWAFLYERLFQDNKPTDAIIRVGSPGMDEIFCALLKYIKPSVLTDDVEKAGFSLVQEKGGKLRYLEKFFQENRNLDDRALADKLIADYGPESHKQNAMEKIKNTVGWEEIYRLLSRLIEEKQSIPEDDGKYEMPSLTNLRMTYPRENANHGINMSIMLKGNPGTGKSTVSKWIGLALQQNGLLPIGKVIKVAKQDLEAGYVGQSAIRTQDKINDALGSVLFVDEAYALFRKEDDGRASFGRDVIDVFVDQMTSKMGQLAFIFAGYPEQMDHFMTSNPGLMRRFGDNIVTIPDYTPDKLEGIALDAMARDDLKGAGASDEPVERKTDYYLDSSLISNEEMRKSSIPAAEALKLVRKSRKSESSDALGPISHYFNNWYADRNRTNFGNAGAALQLAEMICHRARTREMKSRGKVVITRQDFPEGTEKLFECRKPSLDVIRAGMADIIGMDDVRDTLTKITNYLQLTMVQNSFQAKRMKGTPARVEPGHYMFIGNPGTGKTMIAQKLAQILSTLNIIEKYEPVRRTGLELMDMAGGVNGIEKLQQFIRSCNGGVLVIDEAHQFVESNLGSVTVKALLDPMINMKYSMSFVFCCYPEYVNDFLNIEPGLARRINEIIRFDDYTAEDIWEIMMVKSKGYRNLEQYREDVLPRIRELMAAEKAVVPGALGSRHEGRRPQNGGTAEKLLREIKVAISSRLAGIYPDPRQMMDAFDKGELKEEDLYTVQREDILAAIDRLEKSQMERTGTGYSGGSELG